MKESILFAIKPTAFSSHSPNEKSEGFVEYLSRKREENLLVCHRLDRDTSGAMFFAKNKETAALIADCFERHLVEKEYIFLSEKNSKLADSIQLEGNISKQGKEHLFSLEGEKNSFTHFQKIKDLNKYQIWSAKPKTGKTHQIRLHAKHLGIPILGDKLYGGASAARLFLHCKKMEIKHLKITHETELPLSFLQIEELKPHELQWLVACERRKMQFSNFDLNSNCLRWIHKEDRYLSLDQYKNVLWFSDFHNDDRSKDCEAFFHRFKNYFEWDSFLYRKMLNRGQDPSLKIRTQSEDIPQEWVAQENSYEFVLKSDQGQSAGIFLDQRENRKWVESNSKEKRVLNLFSYTSVFSVAAAVGGASEVISVDTSKSSLEWSKENFARNPQIQTKALFFSMEADKFLDSAIKKESKFDLIICDPPSFARNKTGVFKIEKDIGSLIKKAYQCLAKNGHLLFSTNFESWDQIQFEAEFHKALGKNLNSFRLFCDYDYEAPNKNKILKSLFVQKT